MVHVLTSSPLEPAIPTAGEIATTARQLFQSLGGELAVMEAEFDDPELTEHTRRVKHEIIKLIVIAVLGEIERIHGFKITLDFKSQAARARHGLAPRPENATPPTTRRIPNVLTQAIANAARAMNGRPDPRSQPRQNGSSF